MTNFLVFPIFTPQTQIFLKFHHQSLPHRKNPNRKSKSQRPTRRKIFKFQKTLLKQLLNLQRKTKPQLTNTIINILTAIKVTQIQLQKKVHPLLLNSVHLNKLLQIQSPNMQNFWSSDGHKNRRSKYIYPCCRRILQGSQTEPVPPIPPVSENSSKPSSLPWFTFDDIPRHKWQARHQELAAWIDGSL